MEISEKPNIIFLFADDWGKYASVYDRIEGGNTINSLIDTKHIDRIADDGVVFTNAHVPVPSCTPCRSSILNGQYFYKTGMGAILQGAVWDSSILSYPPLMRENGYHIGYTYKAWAPGDRVNAPFGGGAESKLDSEETKVRRESITGRIPYFVNLEDELAYEKAGYNFNHSSQNVRQRKSREKAIEELLHEVKENFRSFLEANNGDKPFHYWFGPTNTHRGCVNGSGEDIWGLNPDDLKGKMPGFIPDVHDILEDFNDCLGEALAWDAAVGVIMDLLAEYDLEEKTVVVISGDHGIPGFPRAKTNLYSFGTEVALIIKWPKHFKGNRVVDDFVNLMDLAPTFLDIAGIDIPEIMDGKSLVPVLRSEKEGLVNEKNNYVLTGCERHVAGAREGNLPYPQRAIQIENYLYIRNFKPDRWSIGTVEKGLRDIDGGPTKSWFLSNRNNSEYKQEWHLAFGKRPYEELYDLSSDPYEMNNLAGEEEYDSIKTEMAGMLDSLMVLTNDPRLNNENCIFDRLPYTVGF